MITKCAELSTDLSKIEIGEAVWLSGHIGDGLAVECSPAWKNGARQTLPTTVAQALSLSPCSKSMGLRGEQ